MTTPSFVTWNVQVLNAPVLDRLWERQLEWSAAAWFLQEWQFGSVTTNDGFVVISPTRDIESPLVYHSRYCAILLFRRDWTVHESRHIERALYVHAEDRDGQHWHLFSVYCPVEARARHEWLPQLPPFMRLDLIPPNHFIVFGGDLNCREGLGAAHYNHLAEIQNMLGDLSDVYRNFHPTGAVATSQAALRHGTINRIDYMFASPSIVARWGQAVYRFEPGASDHFMHYVGPAQLVLPHDAPRCPPWWSFPTRLLWIPHVRARVTEMMRDGLSRVYSLDTWHDFFQRLPGLLADVASGHAPPESGTRLVEMRRELDLFPVSATNARQFLDLAFRYETARARSSPAQWADIYRLHPDFIVWDRPRSFSRNTAPHSTAIDSYVTTLFAQPPEWDDLVVGACEVLTPDALRRSPDPAPGFSTAAIRKVLRRLKRSSSHGPDGIPYAVLLLDEEALASAVSRVLKSSLRSPSASAPHRNRARGLAIDKNKPGLDKKDMKNKRTLAISDTQARVRDLALSRRLSHNIAQFLDERQTGYVPGRSMSSNVMEIQLYVHARREGWIVPQEAIIFVNQDQHKAFDMVDRRWLERVLRYYGQDELVGLVEQLYADPVVFYQGSDAFTRAIPLHRGVLQGMPSSSPLFLLVFQPFLDACRSMGPELTLGGHSVRLCYNAYADNGVFWLKATAAEMQSFFDRRQLYNAPSGARLNTNESFVTVLPAGAPAQEPAAPATGSAPHFGVAAAKAEGYKIREPEEVFKHLGVHLDLAGRYCASLLDFESKVARASSRFRQHHGIFLRIRILNLRGFRRLWSALEWGIVNVNREEVKHFNSSVAANFRDGNGRRLPSRLLTKPQHLGGLGAYSLMPQLRARALRTMARHFCDPHQGHFARLCAGALQEELWATSQTTFATIQFRQVNNGRNKIMPNTETRQRNPLTRATLALLLLRATLASDIDWSSLRPAEVAAMPADHVAYNFPDVWVLDAYRIESRVYWVATPGDTRPPQGMVIANNPWAPTRLRKDRVLLSPLAYDGFTAFADVLIEGARPVDPTSDCPLRQRGLGPPQAEDCPRLDNLVHQTRVKELDSIWDYWTQTWPLVLREKLAAWADSIPPESRPPFKNGRRRLVALTKDLPFPFRVLRVDNLPLNELGLDRIVERIDHPLLETPGVGERKGGARRIKRGPITGARRMGTAPRRPFKRVSKKKSVLTFVGNALDEVVDDAASNAVGSSGSGLRLGASQQDASAIVISDASDEESSHDLSKTQATRPRRGWALNKGQRRQLIYDDEESEDEQLGASQAARLREAAKGKRKSPIVIDDASSEEELDGNELSASQAARLREAAKGKRKSPIVIDDASSEEESNGAGLSASQATRLRAAAKGKQRSVDNAAPEHEGIDVDAEISLAQFLLSPRAARGQQTTAASAAADLDDEELSYLARLIDEQDSGSNFEPEEAEGSGSSSSEGLAQLLSPRAARGQQTTAASAAADLDDEELSYLARLLDEQDSGSSFEPGQAQGSGSSEEVGGRSEEGAEGGEKGASDSSAEGFEVGSQQEGGDDGDEGDYGSLFSDDGDSSTSEGKAHATTTVSWRSRVNYREAWARLHQYLLPSKGREAWYLLLHCKLGTTKGLAYVTLDCPTCHRRLSSDHQYITCPQARSIWREILGLAQLLCGVSDPPLPSHLEPSQVVMAFPELETHWALSRPQKIRLRVLYTAALVRLRHHHAQRNRRSVRPVALPNFINGLIADLLRWTIDAKRGVGALPRAVFEETWLQGNGLFSWQEGDHLPTTNAWRAPHAVPPVELEQARSGDSSPHTLFRRGAAPRWTMASRQCFCCKRSVKIWDSTSRCCPPCRNYRYGLSDTLTQKQRQDVVGKKKIKCSQCKVQLGPESPYAQLRGQTKLAFSPQAAAAGRPSTTSSSQVAAASSPLRGGPSKLSFSRQPAAPSRPSTTPSSQVAAASSILQTDASRKRLPHSLGESATHARARRDDGQPVEYANATEQEPGAGDEEAPLAVEEEPDPAEEEHMLDYASTDDELFEGQEDEDEYRGEGDWNDELQ